MISLLIIISTFLLMEFIAWGAHKYIMHGLLWSLHEDHHIKENPNDFLEKNDSFFIIFATPGIAFILAGTLFDIPYCNAIGFGISLYGFCYFLVHDVFIHQRLKWLKNTDNIYFRAIRRAHKVHHKHLSKEDGECFGMLIVPLKYMRAELRKR